MRGSPKTPGTKAGNDPGGEALTLCSPRRLWQSSSVQVLSALMGNEAGKTNQAGREKTSHWSTVPVPQPRNTCYLPTLLHVYTNSSFKCSDSVCAGDFFVDVLSENNLLHGLLDSY